MPTPTYVPLATITLGTTDSSILFDSIPLTYRDLIVVAEYTATVAGMAVRVRPNSTTANRTEVSVIAGGSGYDSQTTATNVDLNYSDSSTTVQHAIMHCMDYSATDKHKTFLRRSGSAAAGTNYIWMAAGRWADTTAMTSLLLACSSGSFNAGSTFSIYGVN